ncbi:hypothetical protein [Streptomyces xiaopingdaonensis]|uniref:hypothetical protein n=1 Tax=Streptomyces xiaopingdaonensis TaxID=1565415 RepID=UPI0012FEE216|nr:hypothetical protein [Streptomyces xiaopingdaonensis]
MHAPRHGVRGAAVHGSRVEVRGGQLHQSRPEMDVGRREGVAHQVHPPRELRLELGEGGEEPA